MTTSGETGPWPFIIHKTFSTEGRFREGLLRRCSHIFSILKFHFPSLLVVVVGTASEFAHRRSRRFVQDQRLFSHSSFHCHKTYSLTQSAVTSEFSLTRGRSRSSNADTTLDSISSC
ncbi:hypothetical protein RJT34_17946 [Clitoria ternatea]|uniref:Uncharacterized protein n=1 Tax=Clitoria ternatea TaxID=43366 RepID=A0AAN9JA80_CLITE